MLSKTLETDRLYLRHWRKKDLKPFARECPHFKNGDKNEINRRQTKKIAQVISRY